MVSVTIPAFNEETNVKILAERIIGQLKAFGVDYEIIFVDDGSTDGTLDRVRELHEQDSRIKLIGLSRNFGKQGAVKAGIDHSSGDCVIYMDADMQHPPELIPELLEKWSQGYEVVYTIRKQIEGERFFKKITSRLFSLLFNKLSGLDIREGSDFGLIDKRVVDEFKRMNENFLFIRGLINWVGFKQTGIDYVALPRYSGHSKYSTTKLVRLAWNGITSFSIVPLRFATSAGAFISLLAFVYAAYAILAKLFTDKAVSGWASLLVSVLFLGGIQLLCMGLMGEYLGKMFIESKGRPAYIVRDKLF